MKKLTDAFTALYNGDNIVKLTDLRYIPRWIVILIDISIVFFSIFLSYKFLDWLQVQVNFPNRSLEKRILFIGVNLLFMFVFRTYAGIVRHSTFFDLFKILLSSGSTLITLMSINFCIEKLLGKSFYLYPTLFLYFFISVSLMFFFRMLIKQFFNILIDIKGASSKTRVAVVGVSDASVSLARAILHNPNYPYRLEGFVTKRSDSNKAVLLGNKIYNSDYFFKNKNLITEKPLLAANIINYKFEHDS